MRATHVVVSLLGIGLVASMPLVTASCGKKACIRWSDAEGACPSQEEADAYFAGTDGCGAEVLSIDSDADYDGELCCYDVTKRDSSYYGVCTPSPSGPSTSVGTSGPSTTTTSTGTSSLPCDSSGDCGDSTTGCIQCAEANECAGPFNVCVNDQSCIDFVACSDPCGADQACVDACAMQSPVGVQLYNVLLDCIVCTACAISCSGSEFVDPIPGCQ